MLGLHVSVGRLTPETQYQVQLKLGSAGTLTSPVKGDSPKLMTNSGGHLNVRFTNKAEQLEEGEAVFQLNPDAFKEVKDLSEVTGILVVRVSDNKVVAEAEFGARGRGRQK